MANYGASLFGRGGQSSGIGYSSLEEAIRQAIANSQNLSNQSFAANQQREQQEFQKRQQKTADRKALQRGLLTAGIGVGAGAAGGAIAGAALPAAQAGPAAGMAQLAPKSGDIANIAGSAAQGDVTGAATGVAVPTYNPNATPVNFNELTDGAIMSANQPSQISQIAPPTNATPYTPSLAPQRSNFGPPQYGQPTFNMPSQGQRALVGGALGGLGALSGQNLAGGYLGAIQRAPFDASRIALNNARIGGEYADIGYKNQQTRGLQGIQPLEQDTERQRAETQRKLAGKYGSEGSLADARALDVTAMSPLKQTTERNRAGTYDALEDKRRNEISEAEKMFPLSMESERQLARQRKGSADVSEARLSGARASSASAENKLAGEQATQETARALTTKMKTDLDSAGPNAQQVGDAFFEEYIERDSSLNEAEKDEWIRYMNDKGWSLWEYEKRKRFRQSQDPTSVQGSGKKAYLP